KKLPKDSPSRCTRVQHATWKKTVWTSQVTSSAASSYAAAVRHLRWNCRRDDFYGIDRLYGSNTLAHHDLPAPANVGDLCVGGACTWNRSHTVMDTLDRTDALERHIRISGRRIPTDSNRLQFLWSWHAHG